MTDRKRFVEAGWQAYRKMMLPVDMGMKSQRALRRAYFTGAAVLFHTIMATLDEGQEVTAADLQRMTDLDTELREFGEKLDDEVLGSLLAAFRPPGVH